MLTGAAYGTAPAGSSREARMREEMQEERSAGLTALGPDLQEAGRPRGDPVGPPGRCRGGGAIDGPCEDLSAGSDSAVVSRS